VSLAIDVLLAIAVAAALLGSLALLRLTPLERVHAVTFVNVVSGGAVTLAVCLSDGVTPRSVKVVVIWLATLLFGSVSAHVTGRAIHLSRGERR
jgi:multicomponent Na+:H+ antiporter subunit G